VYGISVSARNQCGMPRRIAELVFWLPLILWQLKGSASIRIAVPDLSRLEHDLFGEKEQQFSLVSLNLHLQNVQPEVFADSETSDGVLVRIATTKAIAQAAAQSVALADVTSESVAVRLVHGGAQLNITLPSGIDPQKVSEQFLASATFDAEVARSLARISELREGSEAPIAHLYGVPLVVPAAAEAVDTSPHNEYSGSMSIGEQHGSILQRFGSLGGRARRLLHRRISEDESMAAQILCVVLVVIGVTGVYFLMAQRSSRPSFSRQTVRTRTLTFGQAEEEQADWANEEETMALLTDRRNNASLLMGRSNSEGTGLAGTVDGSPGEFFEAMQDIDSVRKKMPNADEKAEDSSTDGSEQRFA